MLYVPFSRTELLRLLFPMVFVDFLVNCESENILPALRKLGSYDDHSESLTGEETLPQKNDLDSMIVESASFCVGFGKSSSRLP